MDDEGRKHIAELEKNSRFPTGVGQIERGECEDGGLTPMACMFCPYGHMLECHNHIPVKRRSVATTNRKWNTKMIDYQQYLASRQWRVKRKEV